MYILLQRKVKSKFEIVSKGKLRIHMSLMIKENLGRYNILKGAVFDLLNFSVIKIAIPLEVTGNLGLLRRSQG